MEIGQLKEVWIQQQERLDKSLRLNTALLAQMNLGATRRSIRGLSASLGFEIAGLAIIVLLAGSFAADHARELRFFIPALALWVYALTMLIGNVRQIVDIRNIDFDEPVVAIQLRIEKLRLRRAKITGWLLAFGPLMWLPATIVVMRGLLGVDLYTRVAGAWIAGNVILGVAFIPLCIWIARAFGERLSTLPAMRSLINAVAGTALAAAATGLETVHRFENDV